MVGCCCISTCLCFLSLLLLLSSLSLSSSASLTLTSVTSFPFITAVCSFTSYPPLLLRLLLALSLLDPLLDPFLLGDTALLAPFTAAHLSAATPEVTTLKVLCTPENITNPNAVKVVTAPDGRALYFSRAPIPFDRDNTGNVRYWKHLGLYAYRRAALERFAALPPTELEQIERLEQLRLLENGIALYVTETAHDTIGVDTEEDLHRVEAILAKRNR